MRFDAHWLAARGEGPSSTCRPRVLVDGWMVDPLNVVEVQGRDGFSSFSTVRPEPKLPVLPTNPARPLPGAETAGTGVWAGVAVGRTRPRPWIIYIYIYIKHRKA